MLDDLWSLAPHSTQTELRNLLGSFLFSEDDVFKKLGVLSGGERNRYALARMLLHPSNFLLMDEPTNHLDLRAKDILLEALQKFTGTVVFVSHDRYFIDKLATRVFEIADGVVHVFPGNYEDYLWRKEKVAGNVPAPAATIIPGRDGACPVSTQGANAAPGPRSHKADPTRAAASGNGSATAKKKVNTFKLKQLQDRCAHLEALVASTEAGIAECETALQTFVSAEETIRLNQLLTQRRADLQRLMGEWEDASLALEATT
jgi:ATP-binding cassette subfamily F protein 3